MSKFLLLIQALKKSALLIPLVTGLTLAVLRTEAWAQNYTYSNLLSKTYDDMLEEVKRKIQAAGAIEDDNEQAIDILTNALELILSRPDRDNIAYQLVPLIRSPLRNFNAFDAALMKLAVDAIQTLKAGKKTMAQATAYFLLENLISEVKPDAKSNKEAEKILKKIRDAKIVLDKKVVQELKLNAMIKAPQSPSTLAETILKSAK